MRCLFAIFDKRLNVADTWENNHLRVFSGSHSQNFMIVRFLTRFSGRKIIVLVNWQVALKIWLNYACNSNLVVVGALYLSIIIGILIPMIFVKRLLYLLRFLWYIIVILSICQNLRCNRNRIDIQLLPLRIMWNPRLKSFFKAIRLAEVVVNCSLISLNNVVNWNISM